ncbi:cytochrome P450 [Aspergillus karnatakaensis]|uniref:cytochrome P450 n=1 Tax=Aspergillus karnatakaensis TaxID=1810916 RepID=UPI003CCD9AC4
MTSQPTKDSGIDLGQRLLNLSAVARQHSIPPIHAKEWASVASAGFALVILVYVGHLPAQTLSTQERARPNMGKAFFDLPSMRRNEGQAGKGQTQCFFELHRQYGTVVRVGPNEVSIADPKVYRKIYTSRTHLKEARFYEPFQFLGNGNLFGSVDNSIHGSRRKMMSTPFSHQQIITNEHMIVERVETFITRALEKAATSGGRVDVFDLCGLLSLEVICRLSFNYDFSTDPDTSHTLLTALEGSILALTLTPIFPFLRNARYRTKLPGAVGHAYRSLDTWESITSGLLKHLGAQEFNDQKMKQFISAPLLHEKSKHLGRVYTFDEATEEAMGLAVAGSGVTQHTLIFFLYAISKPENRHIQIRLREELLAAGTSFADVSTLPYLTAVLKEIYRVYPVILSTLPRVLHTPLSLPSSEITLPPKTVVGMQNYVHHRDENLFPHRRADCRWDTLPMHGRCCFYKVAIQFLQPLLDLSSEVDTTLQSLLALTLLVLYYSRLGLYAPSKRVLTHTISRAQSIGLNRQQTYTDIPIYENQMHRRVWWTLYSLDRRISLEAEPPAMISDADITQSCRSV